MTLYKSIRGLSIYLLCFAEYDIFLVNQPFGGFLQLPNVLEKIHDERATKRHRVYKKHVLKNHKLFIYRGRLCTRNVLQRKQFGCGFGNGLMWNWSVSALVSSSSGQYQLWSVAGLVGELEGNELEAPCLLAN